MSELLADLPLVNVGTEEFAEMGSYNHSPIQANIPYLLQRTGNYSVYTDLSLDTSRLDVQKFKFKDETLLWYFTPNQLPLSC